MIAPPRRRPSRALTGLLAVPAAALIAVLAVALLVRLIAGAPPGAAGVVPAGALAFVSLSTAPGDDDAQRLARLAPRMPGYRGLRDRLVAGFAPSPGAFEIERDVRPWLGDEAALALVELGGGRFASLLVAEVERRPGAEALLGRVAGERAGVRYRDTVVRRFGASAAAFVGDFLVTGSEPAVRLAIDAEAGETPALADSQAFEDASESEDDAPLELYLSQRGLRGYVRAQPGIARVLAALLDDPKLGAVVARASVEDRVLHLHVRRTGAAGPEFEPELARRVPGGAVAAAAVPSLAEVARDARDAGAADAIEQARGALATANVDLDRDLLGPLSGEAVAWVSPGDPAPLVALAARTRDPRRTREALAKLQAPLVALLGDAAGPSVFGPRRIAGLDAFTLPVAPGFAPSYAVAGDTVILATAPAGLEAFRSRAPRLTAARGFRAVVGEVPARAEALGFSDVHQLLALGEQAGLAVRADLQGIRAAGALIEREGADTTAELFFEIP